MGENTCVVGRIFTLVTAGVRRVGENTCLVGRTFTPVTTVDGVEEYLCR